MTQSNRQCSKDHWHAGIKTPAESIEVLGHRLLCLWGQFWQLWLGHRNVLQDLPFIILLPWSLRWRGYNSTNWLGLIHRFVTYLLVVERLFSPWRRRERGWGKYEEVEEKVEEGRKGHPSASISIYQWTCTDSTAIEIDTRKRCNGPLAALQGTIVGEGFWQFLECDLLDQTIHWMCNE